MSWRLRSRHGSNPGIEGPVSLSFIILVHANFCGSPVARSCILIEVDGVRRRLNVSSPFARSLCGLFLMVVRPILLGTPNIGCGCRSTLLA